MKTDKWMRSPRGLVFGVATGFAEWQDFPPSLTRAVALLIVLFSGIFPGIGIYIILALVLPKASDNVPGWEDAEDYARKIRDRVRRRTRNASYKEVNTETDDMKDRERDWDERFNR